MTMVSLHNVTTLVKTKFATREWSVVMKGLTMMLVECELGNFMIGKLSLVGHSSRIMEVRGAEGYLICGAQRVKKEKNARKYPQENSTPGKKMEPNSVLKEIKRLKKSLRQSVIKGMVTSGQESTQLCFKLVKGN